MLINRKNSSQDNPDPAKVTRFRYKSTFAAKGTHHILSFFYRNIKLLILRMKVEMIKFGKIFEHSRHPIG